MRLTSFFATRLLLAAFFSLYAAVSFAQTAVVSGIWKDNSENYWAFIQDKNSSTVAATRISFDFTTLQAFLGGLNGSNLTVNELNGTAQLDAMIDSAGTSFSGQYAKSSSSEPLSVTADQIFAYQGSEYDGVWQNDAGHYLLYITAQTAGTKIVVVIDLVLNESQDNAASSVVYVGAISDTNFVGTELKTGSGNKNTLRLKFDTVGNGSGSYVSATMPPKVTSFTMTRVIEASGNVALSTP